MPASWDAWTWMAKAQSLPGRRYRAIAKTIRDAIAAGRLRPEEALPSSRALARQLGVHRNTVVAAYRELSAQGWIETRAAQGTFVAPRIGALSRRRVALHRASPFGRLKQVVSAGDLLPLGGADALHLGRTTPDPRLAPFEALGRAYRHVLRRGATFLSRPVDPRGEPRLREALALMLRRRRGLEVSAEEIVITRGSQMALDLIARGLLRKDEGVAVESFGYRPWWQSLQSRGCKLVPLKVDDEGMQCERLEAVHARTPLKAVYTTPHHQYPTAVSLSLPRRLALLDFARRFACIVIEDDYDFDFHYEGDSLPALADEAPGHVLYVGTFSKLLHPAFRLGYIAAPVEVIDALAAERISLDGGGDPLLELAVARLMEEGELQRHVQTLHRVYRQRRDLLLRALHRHLPDVLRLRTPSRGMSLWAAIAPGYDVEAWKRRASGEGLRLATARDFAFDRRARPWMRLGFASLTPEEIEEAVEKAARTLPQRTQRT